jgi:hypothetical protein
MGTNRRAVFRSLDAFLVLTVILLAPGTGLMTLPTPDGVPDQSTVLVADYAHPEKKMTEGLGPVLAGDVAQSSRLLSPVALGVADTGAVELVPQLVTLGHQDRAPPA